MEEERVTPPAEEVHAAANFSSHPPYEAGTSTEKIGRIISVRIEHVDPRGLAHVDTFGQSPDEMTGQEALVIERSLSDSPNLVTHSHSITPIVGSRLMSSSVPLLQEDGQLLAFAVKLQRTRTVATSRSLLHRKLQSATDENALMRRLLEIPHGVRLTPALIESAIQKRASRAAPPRAHASEVPTATNTPEREREPDSVERGLQATPEGPPTRLTADGVHSPLQWEMETEAAINARTRYSPTKLHHPDHEHRRLDIVTQQHLVIRLHDLSVDQKKRRLLENEERCKRELGQLERRVLSTDEQCELGARLHDRQRAHTRDLRQSLQKKYLSDLIPKRSLSPVEQKAMAIRLHDETMSHTREDLQRLRKKYIFDRDVPRTRLSTDQQREMADRLSLSRGGRT